MRSFGTRFSSFAEMAKLATKYSNRRKIEDTKIDKIVMSDPIGPLPSSRWLSEMSGSPSRY
jgi:hypothetical protein